MIISKTLQAELLFQVKLLKEYTPKNLAVLNTLLSYSNTCKLVYLRQDTIAQIIGGCRQTVNKSIQAFIKDGFLTSWFRQGTSCIYYVNRLFLNPYFRTRLAIIFSSLAFLPTMLIPASGLKATQLSYNSLYKKFNSSSLSMYETVIDNKTNESLSTKKIVEQKEAEKRKLPVMQNSYAELGYNPTQKKSQQEEMQRHAVTEWQPPAIKKEDPFEAARRWSDYMQTPEYKRFAALVGEDVAMEIAKNNVGNAVENSRL